MRGVYLGFTLDLDIGNIQLVVFIIILNSHLGLDVKVISTTIQGLTSKIGVRQG